MIKRVLALLAVLSFFAVNLTAGQGISLAADYQNNSNLQWQWAMDSLAKFPFDERDKVLDVGCGDGKITALIAAQISNGVVVGLDISEKMIIHASSKFVNPNLIFLQGNAAALPFKRQFDKVVSFCTLHWVLEQEKALRSFKEALRPGGSLLLVLPGRSATSLGVVSEKVAMSEKWSVYFPNFKHERIYYRSEEYLDLLKKVQLEVISFETSETISTYKDENALMNYVRPLVNLYALTIPHALA